MIADVREQTVGLQDRLCDDWTRIIDLWGEMLGSHIYLGKDSLGVVDRSGV